MNAGRSFGRRVIEALEGLALLCWGQSPTDEQLAGCYRKRLGQLREEGGIELPGSVDEQAAVQGQRQGRQ